MIKNQPAYIPLSRSRRRLRFAATLHLICICMAAIILSGCIKNEFKMIFTLPESVNSTYRIAYYASNSKGGINIESAVAVAAGKAEMRGVTRNPVLVNIYSGSADIPAAVFYAERGDEIRISGNGADPLEWDISGNEINSELSAWRLKNSKAIGAAKGGAPTDARKKLNGIISQYVKDNPESTAAAIILFSYFDASLQSEEFQRLWNMVSANDDFEDVAHLFARQDCNSSGAGEKPGALPDIVVQSFDNNSDTIRFASSGKPALLCYWRKGVPDIQAITDSLKSIAAWRSDSASMAIADVALTADSAQWASDLRRDSLRHTIRAFAPRGLADPQVMMLGVRRTPWYIVGSGKGKKAYAGPDLHEAMKKFRSLKH